MLKDDVADSATHQVRAWEPRPILAFFVSAAILLAPLLASWLAVRWLGRFFVQPPGTLGIVVWVIQALVVSIAAAVAVHRLADRFTPMTMLLKLTLVFPDQAPSRFSTALRAGSTKRLTHEATPIVGSLQEASVHALEMIAALTKHERLTRGHTERVRAYGELLGAELGLEGDELNQLRWGLLLHDIGKLTVPAEILSKPGRPSDTEWAILREHPAAGAAMIEPFRDWLGDAVGAAGQHHEKWEGSGYPNGLSGTEISLAGRICAIADAYDVITSKRSYKEPLSPEHARKELVAGAGTQFDPNLVRTFLQISIDTHRKVGVFGGLLEAPVVATALNAARSIPAIAAAAAVGTVGTASVQTVEAPPQALALQGTEFVMEDDIMEDVGAFSFNDALVSVPPVVGGAPAEGDLPGADNEAAIAETAVAEPNAANTTDTSPTAPEADAPSTTLPNTTAPIAGAAPVRVPDANAPATGAAPTTTAAPRTAPTTTAAPRATTTTTAAPRDTTTTTAAARDTTTTTAAPTTTTGAPAPVFGGETSGIMVISVADLPSTLAEGTLESPRQSFIWFEGQSQLNAPLQVQTAGQSFDFPRNFVETVIPAGTTVCSYFVHTDISREENNSAVVDFSTNSIVGIAGSDSLVNATANFQVPGVDYDLQTGVALGDKDKLSVRDNILQLSLVTDREDRDGLRVFVDCG